MGRIKGTYRRKTYRRKTYRKRSYRKRKHRGGSGGMGETSFVPMKRNPAATEAARAAAVRAGAGKAGAAKVVSDAARAAAGEAEAAIDAGRAAAAAAAAAAEAAPCPVCFAIDEYSPSDITWLSKDDAEVVIAGLEPSDPTPDAHVVSHYDNIIVGCAILVNNDVSKIFGKGIGYAIRVVKVLGKGSGGTVYLVAGTDKTPFALKVDKGSGEQSLLDPSRECKEAVLQSHFLGKNRTKRRSVYLMDLATFGDFNTYFRKHPVVVIDPQTPHTPQTMNPQNQNAALMVLSILRAMQCMLVKGYLYTDMKDLNCLATGEDAGKPKAILGDLGGFMELKAGGRGVATYPDPKISPDSPGFYKVDDTWTSVKVGTIISWSIGILLAQISGTDIDHLVYSNFGVERSGPGSMTITLGDELIIDERMFRAAGKAEIEVTSVLHQDFYTKISRNAYIGKVYNASIPISDAILIFNVKDNNIFRDIIKQCLKFKPEDRCTPAKLCESLLTLLPRELRSPYATADGRGDDLRQEELWSYEPKK